MAPPPPRLSPELIHDVVGEILLRAPLDEPAHLLRASLVCKLWLRIVSDPAFICRYRAFHSAPLLGFFYNYKPVSAPRFVPTTTAASPFPQEACASDLWVHDCRHGRILLENISRNFVVWDPISGHREELPVSYMPTTTFLAAVLCAVAGCDHHDCRGDPFHVLYICIDDRDDNKYDTRICLYSSEAGAWGKPVSVHLDGIDYFDMTRAAIIGDGIYFIVEAGVVILKYDLVKHGFSFIESPDIYRKRPVLMQNEDGTLGLAGVRDLRLHLWLRMVNQDGTAGWVQWRVIELEKILPVDKPLMKAKVIGFAEGTEVLFMSTDIGAFILELKSGRVKKVSGPRKYYSAVPFNSFFTPECARIKLPLPVETD